MIRYTEFTSRFAPQIGMMYIAASERGICSIRFPEHAHWAGLGAWQRAASPFFNAAQTQLDEYFAGERLQFDLPLDLPGTAFQTKVWQALLTIPYGETKNYSQLAAQIGQAKAARPLGAANGKNPISIVVPCHRVIGANGDLVGYAGGLERKRFLLQLEAKAQLSLLA